MEDNAALVREIVDAEGSAEPRVVLRTDAGGRSLYAAVLLPRYFEGQFETVYGYLERRFGIVLRRMGRLYGL